MIGEKIFWKGVRGKMKIMFKVGSIFLELEN